MTQFAYLASMLIMGAVLLVVGYGFTSRRARRMNAARSTSSGRTQSSEPPARYTGTEADGESSLISAANDPQLWLVSFVLLALVGGGGSVALVAGVGGPIVGQLLVASVVVVLACYLFVGTYITSKNRGRPDAQAVAEGCIVLGGLFILTVITTLIVG